MLSAYRDEDADDSTLFICWSILKSELMVTPRIDSASTLIAPRKTVEMCLVVPFFTTSGLQFIFSCMTFIGD